MSESLVKQKSEIFAGQIIKLYSYLCDKKEFIMSKQILRSGTSIGANLAESRHASSKKDFIAKLYIALKEASETVYWLTLLKNAEFIPQQMFNDLNNDCEEIAKILTATIKTMKQNIEL